MYWCVYCVVVSVCGTPKNVAETHRGRGRARVVITRAAGGGGQNGVWGIVTGRAEGYRRPIRSKGPHCDVRIRVFAMGF